MAATHVFTENSSGSPLTLVLAKIEAIKRDEFSECTSVLMTGGTKYAVAESIEEVTKAIENADRT